MSPIPITRTDFCSPDVSSLVAVTLLLVLPLLLGGIAIARWLRERRRRAPRAEEARYWTRVLGVYVTLWLVTLAVLSPMLTRAFWGRTVAAEVVKKWDWKESGPKGRIYDYFALTVRMPSRTEMTFDVRQGEHAAVAIGDQVMAMSAAEPGGEALEPGPSLHSAPAVLGFVIWSGSALLLRRKRPPGAKAARKRKKREVDDALTPAGGADAS